MRTLCVACHADVTAAQCAERKIIRSKARKQLKATLKELRNIPKKTKLSANDNKTVCCTILCKTHCVAYISLMSYNWSIERLLYLFFAGDWLFGFCDRGRGRRWASSWSSRQFVLHRSENQSWLVKLDLSCQFCREETVMSFKRVWYAKQRCLYRCMTDQRNKMIPLFSIY